MTVNNANTIRYSDADLHQFKQVILTKISSAKSELDELSFTSQFHNSNGTDDTAVSYNTLEEGADTLGKEIFIQMIARQRKFVDQLNAALQRIENRTYGVCKVSGRLIPPERLLAVPHTTMCIESKLQQHVDKY